jgi:soluble epoxide hydrolase / lipid-phosphate phosphatase
MVIWRTVLHHPELVSQVFSVCTPYNTPDKEYRSTEDIVKNLVPQFGYQLQLASGEVEKRVKSREDIRQFIKGMFGERGPNREHMFSPFRGVVYENLPKIGDTGILDPKVSPGPLLTHMTDSQQIIDYYTDQYLIHGLHGPCGCPCAGDLC